MTGGAPARAADVAGMKSAAQALAFVADQGVVLASAKGPLPRLIEFIAGEPITGNWWSHPRANQIYNALARVSDHPDVLVCRLVNGKITLVHRRLWPALARVAHRLPAERVARVVEIHTASGRHVTHDVPFEQWAEPEIRSRGAALSEAQALDLLGPALAGANGSPRTA